MITLEFKEPIEVTTAYGDGYVWYMIDYGPHADTLYTVIVKETGECWQMTHKDFRVKTNISLGIRKNYLSPLPRKPEGKQINEHSFAKNGQNK